MKNSNSIYLVIAFMMISFASFSMSKKKTTIKKTPYTGTVVNYPKGTSSFVIVPDNEPSKRFWIDNLNSRFKKDGMKVVFVGEELAPQQKSTSADMAFKLKLIDEKK
jgi:hypothetical protein